MLARLQPSDSVADEASIIKAAAAAPKRASLCLIVAAGDPDVFAKASSKLVDEGRTVSMYLQSQLSDSFNPPGHVRVRFYP
ncbi:MAG: hypothetical protein JW808_07290, partial [Victivallales bacterium]|nr:hypothetical protein [Victivallales bacterium]